MTKTVTTGNITMLIYTVWAVITTAWVGWLMFFAEPNQLDLQLQVLRALGG